MVAARERAGMDIKEVLEAMQQVEREKGIPFNSLLEGLQQALAAAYKRTMPEDKGARVEVDPVSGDIHVFQHDLDEEGNPLLDATGAFENEEAIGPRPFGRIEAQTAKQVILQKIREAERDLTYDEYAGREGDIVTGIVQQSDSRYTLLDLGKVEALMPQAEQVPGEHYEHNARVKAYVVEVRHNPRGPSPSIIVSRPHPGLVKRLFELEVPEVADGTVEIKAIAREAGHRTKIAVRSSEPGVSRVSGLSARTYLLLPTRIIRFVAAPKPRFVSDASRWTSGNLVRTISTVPSPEALSTT